MGEGCGPFREKQACRFSVNILFVCLFVCFVSHGALLLDCFMISGKNDRAMYRLGMLFEMEKAF